MFSRVRDISASCGFVVTDRGREDLEQLETCECIDLLVVDGCFVCRECGTIYGVVVGYSRPPRRAGRVHRFARTRGSAGVD